MENLRMPEAVAEEMRADVLAWARGGTSCTAGAVTSPADRLGPTPVGNAAPMPAN